ncbi:MAG: hypothetical protein B1H12_08730 [Desulfobacteraceae bacterium 4484_190.2]|nr:MAG: hypothetical protein B1H12_08730 [Desulfobacteraceae bacterium 4484_190.2]
MRDTLFLQFYNKTKSGYFDLCNGFSDTYDLCKSKGDFYWTEHEIDRTRWYLDETYENRELPINKGTVYISAIYMNHLYQSYVWAREYPNIRFIVGGPIVAERRIDENGWHPVYVKIDSHDMLPSNLELTGRSVEDWFEVPNFSGKWKIDVPEFVPDDNRVYFSYTLDNGCYWRKCVFCNIALHAREVFRKRKDMKYEFAAIEHNGRKIVRLNTGSITTKYIREVLPALPRRDDIEYRLFMRSAKAENTALKEVLNECGDKFPKLILGFGMEFPTNRMLRYVGKGCNTGEVLEFLRLCHENKIHINANFILGWDNLIQDDISELDNFMDSIPEDSITTFQMRWLFAHPHTKVHDTYKGKAIKLGPFYEGFRTEVDKKQMELNRQAGEIIGQYSSIKHYKVEGMVNIRKHLEKN